MENRIGRIAAVLILAIQLIAGTFCASVFAEDTGAYTIKLNSTEGGTLTAYLDGMPLDPNMTFAPGSNFTVSVKAVADDGYKLASLTYTLNGGDPVKIESGAEIAMKGNVVVDAEFRLNGGTVTLAEAEHGKLTVKDGSSALKSGDTVKAGEKITVTADPDDSYALEKFEITPEPADLNVSGSTASFTMPSEDVSIGASFVFSGAHLTLISNGNGTLTYKLLKGEDLGDNNFSDNSVIELTADPADGYYLKMVQVDEDGETYPPFSDSTSTHVLSGRENTYTATFEKLAAGMTFPIDLTQIGMGGDLHVKSIGGAAPPEYGRATAYPGQKIVITAKAHAGNVLSKLDIDGAQYTKNGDEYTFTMPAEAVFIRAEFTPVHTPELRVQGGNGTATLDKASYEMDEKVTITVKPDAGYMIHPLSPLVTYLESGKGRAIKPTKNEDGTYSFIMPDADPVITVRFAKPYYVKLDCGSGGKVTCQLNNTNGDYTTAGRSVTLNIMPANGYRLTTLTVKDSKGNDIEVKNSRSFTMPESDVTVTARFEPSKDSGSVSSAALMSLAASESSEGAIAEASAVMPKYAAAGAGSTVTVDFTKDHLIAVLARSETDVTAYRDYDSESGKYTWPEDDVHHIYLDELRAVDKDPVEASASSSNESVVSVKSCGRGYVEYVTKGEGTAVITYNGTNGSSIKVEVRVTAEDNDGIYMAVMKDGKDTNDDVAVFDGDTLSILVDICGGTFEGPVKEDSDKPILDIIEDEDLTDFIIIPKESLTAPAETTIVGVDKSGNEHILPVSITEEYFDARDKFISEFRRRLYLAYFIGVTDYFDDDEDYNIWVPLKEYNDYIEDSNYFGDEFKMTEEEAESVKGTLSIDGKTYTLGTPNAKEEDAGDYRALFSVGETKKWGTKGTLELSLGDVTLTEGIAVKKAVEGLTYEARDLKYTGDTLSPDVTVKDGDTVLTEGTDYILRWNGEIKEPGTYTVDIIAPPGSKYAFLWSAEFRVVKEDPSGDDDEDADDADDSGSKKKTSKSVKTGDDTQLLSWTALALTSLAALLAALFARRRARRR